MQHETTALGIASPIGNLYFVSQTKGKAYWIHTLAVFSESTETFFRNICSKTKKNEKWYVASFDRIMDSEPTSRPRLWLLDWVWRLRDRRRRKSEIIHHLLLIHVIAAFVEHTPFLDIYLTMPFSPIMQGAEVFLGWKRVIIHKLPSQSNYLWHPR